MIRRTAFVMLLVATLAAAGCQSQRAKFDQVQPGMDCCAVLCTLGLPSDCARTFWHWQYGEYTDAWVFFNTGGWRVTGTYWQDPTTLRLDEIWPLLTDEPRPAGKK